MTLTNWRSFNQAISSDNHRIDGPSVRTLVPDATANAVNKEAFRPLGTECIGAFGLVFAGCGAIVINQESGGVIQHFGIAVTFGVIIMVMISATGHISGAHFNPAVTFAFAVSRHLPWALVPRYWLAQLTGAVIAAAALRGLFGNIADLGGTQPNGSDLQSFVLEAILTFFLMFVIIFVATDVRAVGQAAANAIGGTVGLAAMFGGPISGASINPARSLGPALVSGTWESQWLYVAAPLIGTTIGALAYQFIRGEHHRVQEVQAKS